MCDPAGDPRPAAPRPAPGPAVDPIALLFLAAQPVIGRAGVEDQEFLCARQRHQRAKAAFIEIGDHEGLRVRRAGQHA